MSRGKCQWPNEDFGRLEKLAHNHQQEAVGLPIAVDWVAVHFMGDNKISISVFSSTKDIFTPGTCQKKTVFTR